MREILFRAKHEDSNNWVYGNLLQYKDGSCSIREKDSSEHGFKRWIVEPETVGQFTGITDKNGVKIFEGDILKVGENLLAEITYVEENVQDYGDEIHAAFHAVIQKHNKTVPIDSYFLNNCKIIGNIHENPELLK